MRQWGGWGAFARKRDVGAGPARTADVRSGLLSQDCAIETIMGLVSCSPEPRPKWGVPPGVWPRDPQNRSTQRTCVLGSARCPRRLAAPQGPRSELLAPHQSGLLWGLPRPGVGRFTSKSRAAGGRARAKG